MDIYVTYAKKYATLSFVYKFSFEIFKTKKRIFYRLIRCDYMQKKLNQLLLRHIHHRAYLVCWFL